MILLSVNINKENYIVTYFFNENYDKLLYQQKEKIESIINDISITTEGYEIILTKEFNNIHYIIN